MKNILVAHKKYSQFSHCRCKKQIKKQKKPPKKQENKIDGYRQDSTKTVQETVQSKWLLGFAQPCLWVTRSLLRSRG